MAVLFEPETLKQEIESLLEFCEEFNIDCYFDNERYNDLIKSGEEEDEEILFTYHTTTELILPESEFDLEGVYNLSEILSMVNEAKGGKLINNFKLICERTALIRITTSHFNFIDSSFSEMDLETEININDNWYKVDIEHGMNSFNLQLTMQDMYNKYVPPITEEDTYIRITSESPVDEKVLDTIFNSYFFELKSTLDFEIYIDPWEYHVWWDEDEEIDNEGIKLRPLIEGRGIQELLEIYKSAFNTTHPEQQILAFSRVIEYVSQTVIRKDLFEKTISKLSSSRALSPDASYILELGKIFDEHRNLRNDYLAFKITIDTCCDVFELVSFAPIYLKKTNKINLHSKEDNQKKALEEIASSISSTRNMFAHAKTNYDLKGDECPKEYLQEFSKFMDIISQQIIKWFSRQPEDTRII